MYLAYIKLKICGYKRKGKTLKSWWQDKGTIISNGKKTDHKSSENNDINEFVTSKSIQ